MSSASTGCSAAEPLVMPKTHKWLTTWGGRRQRQRMRGRLEKIADFLLLKILKILPYPSLHRCCNLTMKIANVLKTYRVVPEAPHHRRKPE